jgi:ABC-type glycerol-3-phosphate transport system substrate-binding protein
MSRKVFMIGLFVLLVLVLSTTLFAAESKTNIDVWVWPGADKSLELAIPAFTKLHPDITVTVTPITAGDPIVQKYLAAVAAKNGGPDVIAIDGVFVQNFIAKGALMDITDLMTPVKNGFVRYKLTEVSDGDKIYACPWDIGPVGLYYRQDIFNKYGLKLPTTWNEYLAAGKQLRAKGNYNITSLINTGDVYWFETLFRQAGNSIFDAKGKESLDVAKTKKVFAYLKNLYESGVTYNPGSTNFINGWTPAFWSAMRSGKIVSYVGAAWFVNTIRDYIKPNDPGYGQWRIAPLPVFEKGGRNSSNLGGSNLGIYPYTKNKKEAWEFIQFSMATLDSARVQADYGTFPAYLPALKDAKLLSHTEGLYGKQEINRVFAELQNNVYPDYYRPAAYSEATLAIAAIMGKYMRDDITLDQAVKEMKDRVNALSAQY